MSDAHSGVEAENGTTDNASVAPSNLAALRSQHLQKLIHEVEWHTPNSQDFHERVVVPRYSFPDGHDHDQQPIERSESPTSSMAVSVAATHSSAFGSSRPVSYAPSLDSGSTWRSEQSIRTSRADSVLVLETLEENADGTVDIVTSQPYRVLTCCFSFLACDFSSRDLEQWDTHCKSHFRGHLPRTVQCPFHCDWTREATTGEQAWQQRVIHVWSAHGQQGLVDTSRRPDSSLIQHLWRKGIIDNAQQKELRMKGRLTGLQPYLRSAGEVREDRIRRHRRA
jgi:hypothetical protein